jgi:metal-sulfur cluster biosynthetic enzyme
LRSITDPEHPLTLEQLAVVSASQIKVSNKQGAERVLIEFTPTIPHCSMATLIGEPTNAWKFKVWR